MNSYAVTLKFTDTTSGEVGTDIHIVDTERDAVHLIDLANKADNIEVVSYSGNIDVDKYRY